MDLWNVTSLTVINDCIIIEVMFHEPCQIHWEMSYVCSCLLNIVVGVINFSSLEITIDILGYADKRKLKKEQYKICW
jgi:hypothetical protein